MVGNVDTVPLGKSACKTQVRSWAAQRDLCLTTGATQERQVNIITVQKWRNCLPDMHLSLCKKAEDAVFKAYNAIPKYCGIFILIVSMSFCQALPSLYVLSGGSQLCVPEALQSGVLLSRQWMDLKNECASAILPLDLALVFPWCHDPAIWQHITLKHATQACWGPI